MSAHLSRRPPWPTPIPSGGRREFDRERSRRRTAKRAAQGLCRRCGARLAAPGRVTCDPCAEKRRAADRARAAQRRNAGIKLVRDPEARKAEYRCARQRAEDRLARGLCARCGRQPNEPDRRLCADCGERQRRADRERNASPARERRPEGWSSAAHT